MNAPATQSGQQLTRLWLTGTGSPIPSVSRAGPSSLLQAGPEFVLIDCGNGAARQVTSLGVDWKRVTHIFITHHHIDHNADLGYWLVSAWIYDRDAPPVVVGPPGTFEYVRRVLFAYDYDVRVRGPHGKDPRALAVPVVEIDDGARVIGREWEATAFRVDHAPVDQAFGYRFDTRSWSAAISGDTRPTENLIRYAKDVDVLIHEVIREGFGIPAYHTRSTEVGRVAARANARRLVLTHFIPGDLPDDQWLSDASLGYEGPVVVGRDLMQVL